MSRLYLIGVDGRGLDTSQRELVRSCAAVVAPDRLRSLVPPEQENILAVTPLDQMVAGVRQWLETGDVVVLAGGDPLFFGIGRRLLAAFGAERLVIEPGLSSMQLAFARFREPWDDAVFISLHGRDGVDPVAILACRKVFLLTDRRNSPDRVARILLAHLRRCGREDGQGDYEVMVGENLGLPGERLIRGDLEDIAGRGFSDLNVMILKNRAKGGPGSFVLGLEEQDIAHSRGLITKDEVRAAVLHRLRLPRAGVFWDIGAGSGSVSVEAARLCPALTVLAVERAPEQLANIRNNIERYGLDNITVVPGEAPAALTGLPDPDRVFVGGSGGALEEIISCCGRRLAESGRLVVTAVLERTRERAPGLLHAAGFEVEISEISVRRRRYPEEAGGTRLFNPISVITGAR